MDELISLKLSLQRALLGEVTQNLIAVSAGVKDSKITIWSYFSEQATQSEADRMSVVGTEVLADFPGYYEIEEQIIFVGDEEMKMLDFWAFYRAIDSRL